MGPAAGLARHPDPLPGVRAPELLHARAGGQGEGGHQAPVRGPDPQGREGHGPAAAGSEGREEGAGALRPDVRAGEDPGPGHLGAVGRGAAEVRLRAFLSASGGRVHVRRAVLLPGREAAPERRPGHPQPALPRELRGRGGARPERAGLPLRLHLLSVRRPRGVRGGDAPLRRARGDQHLPRRVHPHGEPALQTHQPRVQGRGDGGAGRGEANPPLRLPRHGEADRGLPSGGAAGRVHRLRDHRPARGERDWEDHVHSDPGRPDAPRGWDRGAAAERELQTAEDLSLLRRQRATAPARQDPGRLHPPAVHQ